MSLGGEKFRSVDSLCAGLLLAALWVAPAAMGQGQSGAAAAPPAGAGTASSAGSSPSSPAAGAHAQGSSAAKPAAASNTAAPKASDGASTAEPQMVDQSAPAAESLGEIARRARAQKAKPAANGPKVYTDDKLSQLSGHGVSVVGDGNAGGNGSSGDENSFSNASGNSDASGAGASAGGGSGEQYWRGRARAIRDQMAQCDQEISKLQDEIAKFGAVSVDPQSGAMQSIIYVNDRNAKIKQIEDHKAELQTQMESLEDEGRKAGADSGWFR
jgi:hypothetical protein